MTKALHIHRVPVAAVPKAIRVPECAALMSRGLRAAREDNLTRVVAELMTDHRQLWLAFGQGKPALMACWTTEIKEDDGVRWVCVSALAGSNLRAWIGKMVEHMLAWAAKEDCAHVRWAGKQGWRRAVKNARVVGTHDGEALFERAVV